MRSIYALLIVPLLSACQGANPYQAQSQPIPPAPAAAAERIDMSAYPATPRDYGQYQSWSWFQATPPTDLAWLGGEQLGEIISAQLDQIGLRPAAGGAAQLLVNAHVRQQTRVELQHDYVDGYYGQNPWDRHYGAGARIPITRTRERQVLVVQIELIDAADRVTVWSGQGDATITDDQHAQAAALRSAVAGALNGYPPY